MMTKLTLLFAMFAVAARAAVYSVMTDVQGNVVLPSNFWPQNSNALNAVVNANPFPYIPQPASVNLTNWGQINTNIFLNYGTAAYSNSVDFQRASQALTDFATLGTNWAYPRSNPSNFVDHTVTNGLPGFSITNPIASAAYQAASFFQDAGNINAGTLNAARLPDLSLTYEAHVATLTNKVWATNVASGGQLAAATMPAFTGDITTSAGAVATTLKNTGTAGTYRSVTFDAQGRETSGSNPTTFSGYGISDSSANLATAITDETGSGALVFGTSPTLRATTTADTVAATNFSGNAIGLTNGFFAIVGFGGVSITTTTNFGYVVGGTVSTTVADATNRAIHLGRDMYVAWFNAHVGATPVGGTNYLYNILTNGQLSGIGCTIVGNGLNRDATATFSPPIRVQAGTPLSIAISGTTTGPASLINTWSFGQ